MIEDLNWKTQEEIFYNFQESCISVSVVIWTYNQEHEVVNAIKSILHQNTTYRYEIIIHDDASTDGTQKVLKEIESRYPDIITLVLQESNKMQSGDDITKVVFEKCKGQFIAFCDGDDYWLSEKKLQTQISYLVSNPSVGGSFHPSMINGKPSDLTGHHFNQDQLVSSNEIIEGGGSFCPTSSLVVRKNRLDAITNELYDIMPCGDYIFQCLASYPVGMMYFSEPMSTYCSGDVRSFTQSFSSSDYRRKIRFYENLIESMNILNDITNGEFKSSYMKEIHRYKKLCLKFFRRELKCKIMRIFK